MTKSSTVDDDQLLRSVVWSKPPRILLALCGSGDHGHLLLGLCRKRSTLRTSAGGTACALQGRAAVSREIPQARDGQMKF